MKRLTALDKAKSVEIVGVLAYRDDIEGLIDYLENRGLSIAIADTQYEYDSLDELVEKKGLRIKNLRISGRSQGRPRRSLDIELSTEKSHIHNGLGQEYDGLLYSIEEKLRSRSSRLRYMLEPPIWRIFLGLAVFGTIMLAPWVVIALGISYAYLLIPVAGLVLLRYLLVVQERRRVSTILVRKHEREDFWTKNWDKVVLILIGAVIGVLAKWIFDKVL